jgi:phage tail-like protein
MAVQRERPYGNYNYLVDLGTGDTSGPLAGFCEVIFPEAALRVIEYRSGNYKENDVLKVTGLESYTNLVLKRGVIGSLDLYDWWNQLRNGDTTAIRNVIVQLQNEDHTEVVLSWKFMRARPVKYTFSPLNAQADGVLVEEIELAFERMEME